MTVVLDASAILALLFNERGAERVREVVRGGLVSAVNLSETFAKMLDRSFSGAEARLTLAGLGMRVVPFDEHALWLAGELRAQTRSIGASFADRACLALALERCAPVLTADRRWTEAALPVELELIR